MHCFEFLFFFFLSSLFLHDSLAEIICEDLPSDICAFSISSSGKRCLLETAVEKDDEVEYECRTSEVMVERMAGYIESDKCVRDCGVDRNSVGISSDSLHEPRFVAKLCAPACCHNCPNIVDLFFNLAAGEGVFLPDLCAAQRTNPRRSMVSTFEATRDSIFREDSDLAPSSEEAHGPISGEESDLAPDFEGTFGSISDEESNLAPSSEKAPGPISDEESDLASSYGESPDPISGEALAPTPTTLGALASASASNSTSESAPMGALASAPTPARMGALASSPTSASLGALVSDLASAPTLSPLEDMISTSISVRGPAPLGALILDLAPTPTLMG